MPAPSERPSARRAIPVRRLDVDFAVVEVPRWLVDDDPVFSHFLATLSAVFPQGEEFFVDTVREHRAAVSGEEVLRAQVKAFAGQEAVHGREHRALNLRLRELGYRTDVADRDIGRILAVLRRLRPRTLPLAITAGSEHLTGIIAEATLGDDSTRAVLFGHPDIQSLIAWHALEELEHKNVAFDVLDRAGGGYVVRVAGFGIALGVLGGYVMLEWFRAALHDRHNIGIQQVRQFRRNLPRQRLLSIRTLWRALWYVRPGFHPDDIESDALVRQWRALLADRTTVTAGMKLTA